MSNRRLLVLDIDGTLLHTAPIEGGIVVSGRTRPAYFAPRTVEMLALLGQHSSIVLATGRSWGSVHAAVEMLQQRSVTIVGVCVENGARNARVMPAGTPGAWNVLEPHRDWERLRQLLDADGDPACPPFEWQHDFESCLVARADTREWAAQLQVALLVRAARYEPELQCFCDGRKVFLIGESVNKWRSLQTLTGCQAADCFGVGDGLNDLCWLEQVALPCTLRGSYPQVIEAVQRAGGIVSSQEGHAGIAEVLGLLLHRCTGEVAG